MPNGQGTIDDKVKAAPPTAGGSIFDSIGNSIDSLVKSVKTIPSLIKDAVYYTYYTAKASLGLAAGVAIAGGYHALVYGPKAGLSLAAAIVKYGYSSLILPAGMAIGTWLANLKNKVKTTFKQISNELFIGGILGGLLHYIFLGSNYLGNIVKSAYGTKAALLTKGGCALAQMPVFLGSHEYLNRALISDYKPQPLSEMGKKIKKMWPIIPPLIANFTIVPHYLQMYAAAIISAAYGYLKSEPKEEGKPATQPTPAPYGLPPGYAMPKGA